MSLQTTVRCDFGGRESRPLSVIFDDTCRRMEVTLTLTPAPALTLTLTLTPTLTPTLIPTLTLTGLLREQHYHMRRAAAARHRHGRRAATAGPTTHLTTPP